MLNFIHTTLHPECYHGHQARPPFFEGWYYKLIDETGQRRYAVIAGVAQTGDENAHAFVQTLDGETGASVYQRYPLKDFWAASDAFYVVIGPNHFSAAHLKVDLPDAALSMRGDLTFCDLTPWPVSVVSPGMMGWYGWIPGMECYHHAVSLDHSLHGQLEINGESVDFNRGRGYIEKDWGRSQPTAWVWLQSNHFETPDISLSVSTALIPPVAGLGRTFRGFLAGLLYQGTLYRFATYTGAVIERLDVAETTVTLTLRDSLYRLHLVAHAAAGAELRSPRRAVMDRRIHETLKATVDVTLTTLAGNVVIFDETGQHAGLEIVGKLV